MKDKKRFIIVINWDDCFYECFGSYDNKKTAKKALKRIKRGWSSRDWYNARAEVSRLKAPK